MSPGRSSRHYEVVIPLQAGRMSVLRRLATSGAFDGYVAYGNDEKLVFAGGRLAEVRVEQERVTRIVEGQRISESLQDRPFRQVARLVEKLPFDQWRMYGYIAFETALVNFAIPMRQPIDRPLVHLVVPETRTQAARVSSSGLRVGSRKGNDDCSRRRNVDRDGRAGGTANGVPHRVR